MSKQETVFLTFDQAIDLVDRIAKRTENFDYIMSKNEKEAMAQLLSDIGVNVSDIVDVSNLADNYAINAELVTPETIDDYNRKEVREDSLFSWKEDGETHYCLNW